MSARGNTTTCTTTTTTTTTTPTATTGDPKQHVKSHSGRRQSRNKKQSDPFLDLPDDVLKQAAAASTPSPRGDNQAPPPQSLLAHLFFTPINVISFILSLFLIERQQRQWRYQQHQQQHVQQNPTTAQSQSGRWLLSGPEPYQESPETTWHPRLSWRRRGIAKMQITDVLELKGRVAVAIAVWMAVGVGVCAYGIRWLWVWMI